MNVQANPVPQSGVQPPPSPRSLADVGINTVMMRDILLKTMFRTNLILVSDLASAICLPVPLTQELVDLARTQRLIEATGTMHATAGNEMGYQLTDGGKARALDALSASPNTTARCRSRWRCTTSRSSASRCATSRLNREQLMSGMGHLILPPDLIVEPWPGRHLGPVDPDVWPARQRQIVDLATASAPPWATRSMCRAPSNIPVR